MNHERSFCEFQWPTLTFQEQIFKNPFLFAFDGAMPLKLDALGVFFCLDSLLSHKKPPILLIVTCFPFFSDMMCERCSYYEHER